MAYFNERFPVLPFACVNRSNSLLENESRPTRSASQREALTHSSSKEYSAIIGRREASIPLAGFLVSPIGRFWVSPEG
jgi:hypothetical protein